jgi:exosortase B
MAAVLDARSPARAALAPWLPVGAGLLALYLPTFYDHALHLWWQDDYAHAPIILAVVAWLIWKEREALVRSGPRGLPAAPAQGVALLALGLLLYVLGRSQEISLLEIGSLAPVLAGVFLAMRGWAALRAVWFAILFVVFMLPLPQFVVEALAGGLKQSVSAIADEALYAAGYPVARDGVVLAIGPYQVLVADACSGLNSMFSLLAVGALYLYLIRRRGWLHNGAILASLLPVAFCANVVRVILVVLITYHFGDAAGQGFVHRFSGIVLFCTMLALILALDAVLARTIKPRAPG